MAQSNKAAVDANNIDPDERLDLTIARNGSLTLNVALSEIDEDDVETPVDLTGCTIVARAKLSYQAKGVAMLAAISARDDANGVFVMTYDATEAKGLGIDVLDLVHDIVVAPTGGSGSPRRYFAGLLTLSKGT